MSLPNLTARLANPKKTRPFHSYAFPFANKTSYFYLCFSVSVCACLLQSSQPSMGKKSPFSDVEAARYPPPPPLTCYMPPPPPPTFYMPPPTQWFSWLVPLIFLANIAMFVYSMYINDCPDYLNEGDCLWYQYLGKFSFQPFNENPLLGPSVRT